MHIIVVYSSIYGYHILWNELWWVLQLFVDFVFLQTGTKCYEAIPKHTFLFFLHGNVIKLECEFVKIFLLYEEECFNEKSLPPLKSIPFQTARFYDSFKLLVLFFNFFPFSFANFGRRVQNELGFVFCRDSKFVGDVVNLQGEIVGNTRSIALHFEGNF